MIQKKFLIFVIFTIFVFFLALYFSIVFLHFLKNEQQNVKKAKIIFHVCQFQFHDFCILDVLNQLIFQKMRKIKKCSAM